jgi:glycosyltransferase involved in cell wall biosynthesis
MRILMLAEVNSSHTIKWVRGLLKAKLNVALFSFSPPERDYFGGEVQVFSLRSSVKDGNSDSLNLRKARYFGSLWSIMKLLRRYKPDILHAHYASSYGLIGALCRFSPFIVSVWGSDVFEFAPRNRATELVMRFVLKRADRILSTSRVMAAETERYTPKKCEVLAFGVDTDAFSSRPDERPASGVVRVGTVKSLEECYGIDLLLRAFARARELVGDMQLELLIVGGGSLEASLRKLSSDLKVEKYTTFAGRVPYDQVSEWYTRIDVFANLSRAESFGVSVLEASACGIPVVVSDAGGLPEVVRDGASGFIVPKESVEGAARAIATLSLSSSLRQEMGMRGHQFVATEYSWQSSIDRQIGIYAELASGAS